MPRYFFHVHDGRDIPDDIGTDLAGPDEARTIAVTAMGEAVKDLGAEFWKSAEWWMNVIDEQGATVCTLSIKGVTIEL